MERRAKQRDAVATWLADSHEFRTAQEIHDELRHSGVQVGLATVYRSLQSLAESGEIDVVRTKDGSAAYRRCTTGHHHHLICRDCGRTVELAAEDFEAWLEASARRHGFSDIDHELEIYGRCDPCAALVRPEP